MKNKVFTWEKRDDLLLLYKHKKSIAFFYPSQNTLHFMGWLVDTLNENYEKYPEKMIKELGF